MNMSKTAALKAASKSVSPINRRSGTDYVFYADLNAANGCAASYEVRASSYRSVQRKRSLHLAQTALGLMGMRNEDTVATLHAVAEDPYTNHTAKGMLVVALIG
jgi:hypothetical protein